MPTNNSASIEVEGLVREFKKGPRAVDGIDLEVAPGEIYGFLGPNGAGKSTTVHMLTTLLPPTAGTARVAGHDIVKDGPRVRDEIGVALQEAALDQFLTAREHMRLQAGMHGIPKAEAVRRGDELIARVGLTDEIGRPTVEAAPLEPGEVDRMREVLGRFGSPERADRGHVAVRLDEGTTELADVVRALDAEGIAVQDLEIHAPTLDDVFLAKTGRRL